MPKESTFVGGPPGGDDEGGDRPRASGPRPVTTAIPTRRGTGQQSSGFGGAAGRTPMPPPPPAHDEHPDPTPGAATPGRHGPAAAAGPGSAVQRQDECRQALSRPAQPRFFPPQPRSLAETGLSQTMGEELVLKALFFAGELRGADISKRIKLPQLIVDEIIEGLRKQKFVDLKGGGGPRRGQVVDDLHAHHVRHRRAAADPRPQPLQRPRAGAHARTGSRPWPPRRCAACASPRRAHAGELRRPGGEGPRLRRPGPRDELGPLDLLLRPARQRQDGPLPVAGALLRRRHLGAARPAGRRLHHPRVRRTRCTRWCRKTPTAPRRTSAGCA